MTKVAFRACARAAAKQSAQGIVHRDLKPENIFIDRRGQSKVMDFGIARSVESSATRTGSIVGTPAYMSPEQAEGKTADARSDIYALGLIFYEMFAGRAPFEADTPVAFALKQIRETPPPPRTAEPYVPLFLDRAIQRCLEKKPDKRFQSVAELSAALAEQPEAVVSVGETPPQEAPLPDQLATWQRWDWGLLGGAVVSFALFFVLFDRVFPYGSAALRISGSDAIAATQALLAKYAPELKDRPLTAKLENDFASEWFSAAVIKVGLKGAVDRLQSAGSSGFSWSVTQGVAGTPTEGVRVAYDHQGRVLELGLPPPPGVSMPKQTPTQAEVLPFAVRVAEDLFHVKVADVAPTPLNFDTRRGLWTFDDGKRFFVLEGLRGTTRRPVLWILPGDFPNPRKMIRLLVLPDRLFAARLDLESTPGAGWDWTQLFNNYLGAMMVGGLVLVVYCLVCLVLSFTRKLYKQTSRTVWVASFITALAVWGLFWRELPQQSDFHEANKIIVVLGCIVTLVLHYALWSVPYRYVSKTLPAHLKTLSDLLMEGLRARPAGLAILRGIGLGALYLAFHSGSLFLLGTLRVAATSSFWAMFALGTPPSWERVVWVLALAFLGTIVGTWLGVGLPFALLRRVTNRLWLVLAAIGLFWTVTAASLPGASAFPVLPLYLYSALQGVFFAAIFWRYDLLTSMMAALTIETWLLCYPLDQMFGGIEPWPYAAALWPWFLILLLGAVLWLRPPVVAAWRRATAVLE